MSDWEIVIGLEVHAQLLTQSKIFCAAPTEFGQPPNQNVTPVCLGLPGVLPVLNRHAVQLAVRAALALDCTVHRRSQFSRKHYFYPDLPKGYQISQFDRPLATEGSLRFETEHGAQVAKIQRIHMEEDAGKSIHLEGRPLSVVDFNRAGVPLIEIVGYPDLHAVDDASAYLKELRSVLRYTGVSDGNMEEGSFRCDANVSMRRRGEERLGTRTEIKNINSFRHVRQALTWEVERQIRILEAGDEVVQETRLWDPVRGVTAPMRSKEEAHDYRYFPDPDLPILEVDDALLSAAKAKMPELAGARRARYQAALGLPAYDAGVLAAERDTADYFEALLEAGAPPKEASNWVMGEVLAALGRLGVELEALPLRPARLASLIQLVQDGAVGRSAARQVFEAMLDSGEEAAVALDRLGLGQVSDGGLIAEETRKVLTRFPDELARYRGGEHKLVGFFIGQVMRAMQGKGNPSEIRRCIEEELSDE